MLKAAVVIREPGGLKPMSWYTFMFPELPRLGDYLSIGGPDIRAPLGEDVVVRRVWWRLNHLAAGAPAEEEGPGHVTEVFIECDIAEGPYACAAWHQEIAQARERGVLVEKFEVTRSLLGTAKRD